MAADSTPPIAITNSAFLNILFVCISHLPVIYREERFVEAGFVLRLYH